MMRLPTYNTTLDKNALYDMISFPLYAITVITLLYQFQAIR